MATIVMPTPPSHSFEHECKEIHDSWGRTEQLIRALTSKTELERARIRETYKAMYGEDLVSLISHLRSDESTKLCAGLSLMMLDPHDRDAVVAREAIFGCQGDAEYKALVEIFAGRKSSHVALIEQAYQAKYNKHLDQDIVEIEPPHPYQKILIALAASHKAHEAGASQHVAKCDARRLYKTGEGSEGGIEEGVVLEMLSKRSIPQLQLSFSSYKHIYGHDYTKVFKFLPSYLPLYLLSFLLCLFFTVLQTLSKLGNSGEFEDALKMVIKCMCSPPRYYAKVLYTSMNKGRRIDRAALERVMMRRADVDMEETQRVFKNKYGVQVREAISQTIPCGDYRDFLLALASKTSSST